MHAHHVHRRHAQAGTVGNALANAWAAVVSPFVKQDVPEAVSTVYVYYTQPATFEGATGALITQTGDVVATSQVGIPASAKPTTTTPLLVAPSSTKSASKTSAVSVKSTNTPSVILPTASTSVPTNIAIAIASATTAVSSRISATASPTATAAASQSSGMSTASKAGLVIGVVLGIGAILSLVFFCLRQRRKAAEQERIEDEKSFSDNAAFVGAAKGAQSVHSAKSGSTAPRLSLRPVTQFLPSFGGDRSNNVAMSSHNPAISRPIQQTNAWDRPSTANSHDSRNPFGAHAELDEHNAAGAPVIATGPGGPFTAGKPVSELAATNVSTGVVAGAAATGAAAAAAAAAAGIKRSTSKREDASKELDFTRADAPTGNPSPIGTEFNMSSAAAGTQVRSEGAAAIAAAGGPYHSTVHRVQLDFKPNMDDELELRAGQLIRLLHEYDDGWALCIRLDRSQQGVVPRTCLSTRPVKPRPAGPPPSQQIRNGPPRPGSAQSNRGQGPYYAPRPGSAQSNRGPGPMYNHPGPGNGYRGPGPHYGPRPGSAQSNRGPGPMYNYAGPGNGYRGPSGPFPRPGSAQSNRQPVGPFPRPGSAQSHRVSPPGGYPRPSSAQSNRVSPPYSNGSPRSITPTGAGSPPLQGMTGPMLGHRVAASVDRKPVAAAEPGQAM